MAKPSEPGDPGFSWGGWIRHGLNVALDMLEVVGAGLPLFGALRNRFPGLNPQEAGGLAANAADAAQSGAAINPQQPLEIVDWLDAPAIPGSSIWQDNTGERWRGSATVVLSGEDGIEKHVSVNVFGTDLLTKEQMEAAAIDQAQRAMEDTSRDGTTAIWVVEEVIWDALIQQF